MGCWKEEVGTQDSMPRVLLHLKVPGVGSEKPRMECSAPGSTLQKLSTATPIGTWKGDRPPQAKTCLGHLCSELS